MIAPTTKCSHDPLRHYLPCAGCAQDEVAALRSRVEVLEAALSKLGGTAQQVAEQRNAISQMVHPHGRVNQDHGRAL